MNLKELYEQSRKIPDNLIFYNKYTYGYFANILDIRYLDINDAFSNDIKISSYLAEYKHVLLFPTRVNNVITTIVVRPLSQARLSSKEAGRPLTLGGAPYPFGLEYINDNFKYGDNLILVEGIGDFIGLKLINKDYNIIAIQSNNISKNTAEFISSLTNNVTLLLDNDKAGLSGANKTSNLLKGLGVNTTILKQFSTIKDTGDIVDMVIRLEQDLPIEHDLKTIVEYYKAILK